MAHPNEDLVRRGFAAFATGNLDALRSEYFAADIVWHFPGRSPLAGDFTGVDAVIGWLGRSFELSGGTLNVALHDAVANDEHAVALTVVSAQRDGKSLHDNSVQLFHVRDGKIAESWIHPWDAAAADEFWS